MNNDNWSEIYVAAGLKFAGLERYSDIDYIKTTNLKDLLVV